MSQARHEDGFARLESPAPRHGELVALLQALIQAHPIYDSEGILEAQRICAREMEALGLQVTWERIDHARLRESPHYVDVTAFGGRFSDYGKGERFNLVGRAELGPGGPALILNGHLDVEFVTGPGQWAHAGLWRSGALRDGRIYGRGASDMLGGVACFLFALKQVMGRLGKRGSIEVQLVVDEEIGGNGTLWSLMSTQRRRDAIALIGEPTGGVVCHGSRGFHQFKVVCEGRPVHMVFARPYDNANQLLAVVSLCLEELDAWVGERCANPGSRYIMYGEMSGGSDAAVPASSAELRVTAALPVSLSLEQVIDELRRLMAERLRGRCDRLPTVEPYGIRFAGSSLSDLPLCDALVRNGVPGGTPLTVDHFPSPCDARLFEAFGIPSVVFGPGDLRRAHGADEYVTEDELAQYAWTLSATLLELFAP